MKKFLFFAAAAIAMLASCSQNDDLSAPVVAENNDATPVQFGTYVGKGATSRAGATGAIETASALQTATFGVFAYNTGATAWASAKTTAKPNFMWNQQVTYSTDHWTYTPIKYWPNGIDAGNSSDPYQTAEQSTVQQVSFFAYAPYVDPANNGTFDPAETSGITALTANNATGEPKVTYVLAANAKTTSAVDLLWGLAGKSSYNEADGSDPTLTAGTSYNVDLTKQAVTSTTDENVKFLFKHALAKMGGAAGLKVQLDVDDNNGGALDANSCVTIKSITIKNVANKVAQTGVFNLATGTWESPSMATVAEGAALNVTLGADEIATALYCATSPTYSSSWSQTGVTNSPTDVYKTSEGGFFLMPDIDAQELKVTIEYTVTTKDGKLEDGYSVVDQTITNTVTLPELDPNKTYTLIMHLGLTSVKFSADVAEWDNNSGSGNNQNIWLPSNVVE